MKTVVLWFLISLLCWTTPHTVLASSFGAYDAPSQGLDIIQHAMLYGATTAIERERKKHPMDVHIVLYFFVAMAWDEYQVLWRLQLMRYQGSDIVESPNVLPPGSPYRSWRKETFIMGEGVTGLMDPNNKRNSHFYKEFIWPHYTTGLSIPQGGPDAVQVKYRLIPQHQETRLCDPIYLSVQGSYKVDDRELTISLPPEEFKWVSIDDKGRSLTPASKGSGGGQGSSVVGETGQGLPVEFTSSLEGTYRVMVSPKARGKYIPSAQGSELGTVVVRPPTVKEVVLKGPSNMVLNPGDRAQFEAWAFFEESCVPPKQITHDPDAIWNYRSGLFKGSTYIAPEPKPSGIKITSPSHPDLVSEVCDTVSLAATVSHQTLGDSFSVFYRGKTSNTQWILVKPPDTRNMTQDNAVKWSPVGPSFVPKEPGSVTVTATMGDASDSIDIQVKPPEAIRLEIDPKSATMDMGEEIPFRATVYYRQECLDPKDVTAEADWSASSFQFHAEKPGTFQKTVKFNDLSASATITVVNPSIVIEPQDTTLTLGETREFRALRMSSAVYKDVTDSVQWSEGTNRFTSSRCGEFKITAVDPKTQESATAKITVMVDESACVEIRRALKDQYNPDIDPEYLKQSRKWLAVREELLKAGCDCGVPFAAADPETRAGTGETDGGDADEGFSDEGTIIGSGWGQNELEPFHTPDEPTINLEIAPSLANEGSSERPGRPSAPEAGDGFADLGSSVGSTPSGEETVTYFDRDWLPRSWKTSGNAAETRAEIYQTASRMGWAVALAEYTGPSSDPLISDHVLAASGHMERANAASFAPHKAWPDWSNRRNNYNRWIQRLTSGTQISREYFRKGLAGTLKSEAGGLKRQLETIATGQAGTLQNCDTYIFEIGYQLAFASQLQGIAIDGLEAGQKKDWARKLWNRASSSITSAVSAIQKTKPGPGRVGCSDFTPLSKELSRVQSRLSSALEPEVHSVWNQGLAVAAGGSDQLHDSDDLAGEWVISTAPFSWGNYINRNAGARVDPHAASTVRVRIEPRGEKYVGIISRQGQVPVMSDSYTYEQTGRNRIQLFHDGLEYLRLKKTGRNLFEGDILQVTLNNRLEPRPVYIVVYDEAAKLLERFQDRDREQLTRGSKWGVLMLRLDAAGPSVGPNMEAVGRHVFTGMENEIPQGARIVFRGSDLGKIGDSWAPFYGFKHQKPFRFESVTDNNPGLGINLYYLGDARSSALDDGNCGFSPEYYRPLQSSRFERHGGKGVYSLVTSLSPVRKPIDYTLLSRLIWSRDEWVISIYGHDYPNHSGTQFGGLQGQLNHMIRLLDRLVPRLKTIPTGAMAPGNGSPSFRQSGSPTSPSPGGMNLLGIEAQ